MAVSLKYKDRGGEAKEGSIREEKSESPAEAASEGEAPQSGDMAARHAQDRSEMFKRHETARRLLHGNERDARRKLDAEHEKEVAVMMERHQQEMAAGDGAAGGAGES